MENIKESITTVFPDINRESLYNTNYPRLRIYFDGKNLTNILDMSVDIMSYCLRSNVYIAVILYSNSMKELPSETLLWLQQRWIYDKLIWEKYVYKKSSGIFAHIFFVKIEPLDIIAINKALVEKDHGIEPILFLNCYCFNLDEWICINLYDDRGMDIIMNDLNKLESIRISLKKQIGDIKMEMGV